MYKGLYLLRHGFKGLAASWMVTLISTLTIAVSLALIGFFILFSANVGALAERFSRSLNLTVYLKPATPEGEILRLKTSLEGMASVERVRVKAPSEIKDEIRELLGTDFIAGLPDEALPLQPAVEITLTKRRLTNESLQDLLNWIHKLEQVDWVDEVVHGVGTYRLVLVLVDALRYVGLLIATVVSLAALFFVYSTIRLAVLARREEIEVLRLCGATNAYIKVPFFLQGGLQGLVGGILALVGVSLLNSHVASHFSMEYLVSLQLDLLPSSLVALFVAGGLALGLSGTWFSVGKYLKI
jgi:cell division transport system permease protein